MLSYSPNCVVPVFIKLSVYVYTRSLACVCTTCVCSLALRCTRTRPTYAHNGAGAVPWLNKGAQHTRDGGSLRGRNTKLGAREIEYLWPALLVAMTTELVSEPGNTSLKCLGAQLLFSVFCTKAKLRLFLYSYYSVPNAF